MITSTSNASYRYMDVVYLSAKGFCVVRTTKKDLAIEEIKTQPFFDKKNPATGTGRHY